MLRSAYFSLKREAAPGIDGETWQHYGEGLEEHLRDLSDGWPGVRIERVRFNGGMCRKPMAGNGRSACRCWKTRSSRRQRWRYSTSCMRRNFLDSRMASAWGAARTMHWRPWIEPSLPRK